MTHNLVPSRFASQDMSSIRPGEIIKTSPHAASSPRRPTIPKGAPERSSFSGQFWPVSIFSAPCCDGDLPLATLGQAVKLSEAGLNIFISRLYRKVYSCLLRSTRSVSIHLEDPFTADTLRIQGRILMLDYRHQRGTDYGQCYLGVVVDEDRSSARRYWKLVIAKLLHRSRSSDSKLVQPTPVKLTTAAGAHLVRMFGTELASGGIDSGRLVPASTPTARFDEVRTSPRV